VGGFLHECPFFVELGELGAQTFSAQLDFFEADLPRLLQVEQPLLFSLPLVDLSLFLGQQVLDLLLLALFLLGAPGIVLED
jgi:hypothetical protein